MTILNAQQRADIQACIDRTDAYTAAQDVQGPLVDHMHYFVDRLINLSDEVKAAYAAAKEAISADDAEALYLRLYVQPRTDGAPYWSAKQIICNIAERQALAAEWSAKGGRMHPAE